MGKVEDSECSQSSAKKHLSHDIKPTSFTHEQKSFTSSNVYVFQMEEKWKLPDFPNSLCFQLNCSVLQEVTEPKLVR